MSGAAFFSAIAAFFSVVTAALTLRSKQQSDIAAVRPEVLVRFPGHWDQKTIGANESGPTYSKNLWLIGPEIVNVGKDNALRACVKMNPVDNVTIQGANFHFQVITCSTENGRWLGCFEVSSPSGDHLHLEFQTKFSDILGNRYTVDQTFHIEFTENGTPQPVEAGGRTVKIKSSFRGRLSDLWESGGSGF